MGLLGWGGGEEQVLLGCGPREPECGFQGGCGVTVPDPRPAEQAELTSWPGWKWSELLSPFPRPCCTGRPAGAAVRPHPGVPAQPGPYHCVPGTGTARCPAGVCPIPSSPAPPMLLGGLFEGRLDCLSGLSSPLTQGAGRQPCLSHIASSIVLPALAPPGS